MKEHKNGKARKKNRPESKGEIIFKLFTSGFLAGVLAGISYKVGIDVDEDGLAIHVFNTVCSAFSGLNPNIESFIFKCSVWVFFLTIAAFAFGIHELYYKTKKIGDVRVGIAIYGIGWILGLLFAFKG